MAIKYLMLGLISFFYLLPSFASDTNKIEFQFGRNGQTLIIDLNEFEAEQTKDQIIENFEREISQQQNFYISKFIFSYSEDLDEKKFRQANDAITELKKMGYCGNRTNMVYRETERSRDLRNITKPSQPSQEEIDNYLREMGLL